MTDYEDDGRITHAQETREDLMLRDEDTGYQDTLTFSPWCLGVVSKTK